jgi:cell division protein FtsB
MRGVIRLLVGALVLGGILFLFVLPGRTWLGQERSTATAQRQLIALTQENATLRREAAQLQSPAYIEQLARQDYDMVLPGQQLYSILPPTPTTTTTTLPPAKSAH